MHRKEGHEALEFLHTDTGSGGKRKFAVHDGDAGEQIVGYEEVTVQVGEIDGRGELGGGGDGAGGFGHAAEHDFHAQGAGELYHPVRFAEAGTLHELDVDAGEEPMHPRNVREALDGLIGKQRKRTAFVEPGLVFVPMDGKGLFHHHDAMLFEPVDHVQRLEAFAPALVHVHGDGRSPNGWSR